MDNPQARWMGPVTDEDMADTTAMAPHNRVIVRQCEAAGVTAVVRRHDIAGIWVAFFSKISAISLRAGGGVGAGGLPVPRPPVRALRQHQHLARAPTRDCRQLHSDR